VDALKVKPGPRPKLGDEAKPARARQSPRDAAIRRQIRQATAAEKAGAAPPGTPPAGAPPAGKAGKFETWAKGHKGQLATGVVASLIAAYIFLKLNGSSSLPTTGSSPTNPQPGGPGSVPTSGGGGGDGGGGGTPPPTGYSRTPSAQTDPPSGGQSAGGTRATANETSRNTYARPVNKSGIPTLGKSAGAINPNVAHDTIPAGHSAQNVLPNLAPQIRRATNIGAGRAQPTVKPREVYRTVSRPVYRRITTAAQVHPTAAYSAAHGSRSSYAPQVRALR